MRRLLTLPLLLLSPCLLPVACSTAEKPAATAAAGEYHELLHKGRIYVLGSRASLEKVQQGQDLVFKVTLTGAGPQGETVVIEADKEGSATEDRLRAEYFARHPRK